MFFKSKKRKGSTMCKKLGEIHKKRPEEFLADIGSLPVDIGQILNKWEIEIAAVSFDELQKDLPIGKNKITGLAYAQNDDLLILYSKESDMKESRFTLAHELGHCCLHMDVNSSCHIELQTANDVHNISQNKFETFYSKKEEEADKFARDLLIPTNILKLLLSKNKKLSVELLSDFFAVPITQMQKKLIDIQQ